MPAAVTARVRAPAAPRACSIALLLRGFAGPQQPFEMGDVIEQGLAAPLGQRIAALRPALNEAPVHCDVAGVLELAQMHAGIAVGRPDGIADVGKVDFPGAREKGDDRDPNAALQHLVDRIVVEVDHGAAGRPRHSRKPGISSNSSMSTADSGSTSMRWRKA